MVRVVEVRVFLLCVKLRNYVLKNAEKPYWFLVLAMNGFACC